MGRHTHAYQHLYLSEFKIYSNRTVINNSKPVTGGGSEELPILASFLLALSLNFNLMFLFWVAFSYVTMLDLEPPSESFCIRSITGNN